MVYERTESKKFTEDYEIKAAFNEENTEKLKKLLEEKLKRIENYQKNYSNEALYKEIKPFVTSLKLLSKATLEKLDENKKEAQILYEKAKNIEIEILKEDGLDQIKVKTSGVIEEIYGGLG